MKVLLLEHPRGRSATHFNDIANAPLSSCLISGYVASVLQENDIETEILDAYRAHYSFSQMVKKVVEKECDILGIHLVYSWEHTSSVLNAIDEIRSTIDVPVIVYGFYPTFAYEFILKSYPSIDYVIIGEPEINFFKFCSQVKKGRHGGNLNGIAFRRGEELIVHKRQKVIENLDMLPFPFRTKEHLEHIGANIMGSRGCYGNCTFCHINNFYGKRCTWRGRTPENVSREIETILGSLSKKYIYFVDANFFGPGEEGQRRAERIAECLRGEKGLKFGFECRVNDVQEKSLSALAGAGLQDVFLGVESGSKRSLERIRKGTSIEQGVKAITLLRNYGIEPYIGFIMFESDSELQDLRDNFNFLTSNNLLNRLITTVDLLHHPQIILMGTESYETLKKMNRMKFCSHGVYQGTFTYMDDRVAFLSEVISFICRYLLTVMEKKDSLLYWRRGFLDTHHYSYEISDRLNQWLVKYFEELLIRAEHGEITYSDESKSRCINESITLINRIIDTTSNNDKK